MVTKKRAISTLACALGLTGGVAYAHPVAYQGALGVMTWNQPFLSDYWLTYSFRPDAAIAGRYMRMNMKDGDFRLYMPQFDYLVKRWNEADHQTNIYAYGGFGGAHINAQSGVAGMIGVEADAESRKYFVMAKYEGMVPSVGSVFQHVEGRVGIAPYEAEYNEIASWLMLQVQYHPALVTEYAVTPLVRFFYKSVLWETGVSLNGDWMLNFMFHF
jgi:hypothetical protein